MVFKLLGKKIHPIIFCRTYWNCTGPEFTKFWNLNGIGDGNDKNLTRHVFKYKHTKWLCWCITANLNYKNTMINRITMETVACLRSKCHLKQNLIPSWQWSLRHTSCISDFRCKTKYTNKKFCRILTGIFGSISDFLPARSGLHTYRKQMTYHTKRQKLAHMKIIDLEWNIIEAYIGIVCTWRKTYDNIM